MPVKRRVAKRRLDPAAEAEAWECYFDCGRDFFRDLPRICVETDQYSRAPEPTAEEAWQRLGGIFLANRKHDPHREPWALLKFGEPQCR